MRDLRRASAHSLYTHESTGSQLSMLRSKSGVGIGEPLPALFVPNDADKWIWAHGRRRNTQSKEIRKTFRLIRTQTIILTLNNKMRFNKDCPASSPLKRV